MKRVFKIVLLSILFFVAFRIGFRTPLDPILFIVEGVLSGLMIMFMAFRVIQFLSKKEPVSSLEAMLLAMFIFPFWAAFSAYYEYGQPLFYGIATQRSFFLYLSALFVFYLLKYRVITTKDIQTSFLATAWVSMAIFIVTANFINPEQYFKTIFIGYNELKGGYIFKFVITLIVFAFLFYVIKYFITRKTYYLLLAAPHFYYMTFVRQDRSTILVAMITLLLFFLFEIYKKARFKYFLYTFMVIGVLFSVVALSGYTPDPVTIEKYNNIWLTVTGQETTENSTNLRRIQTLMVWPDILRSPLFGNGELSLKWEGGFARVYGYFYPTDIGIVGEMFIYGFLGTFLINAQFIFAFWLIKRMRRDIKDAFQQTCIYFLVICFFDSLTAGQTVFYAANSVVMIAIIYSYYHLQKVEQVRIKQNALSTHQTFKRVQI
ncbi:MAG TPA: hypothetical protein PKH65_08635 [Bacteroidia bacterium]|nr:hypothetical protein [Bacteroidia bacterium]HNT80732.1 hypothetical protein [Bacteroidia bacterium]